MHVDVQPKKECKVLNGLDVSKNFLGKNYRQTMSSLHAADSEAAWQPEKINMLQSHGNTKVASVAQRYHLCR